VIDTPPCETILPGISISAPLLASFLPGGDPEPLRLRWRVSFLDMMGNARDLMESDRLVERRHWEVVPIETVSVAAPDEEGLLTLATWLEDAAGSARGRNYAQWIVGRTEPTEATARRRKDGTWLIPFPPASAVRSEWPLSRSVNDGQKVSGLGTGWFDYEVPLPRELRIGSWGRCELLLEAGARRTLPRDRDRLTLRPESDLTLFSAVAQWESGSNPNDYPQTDETPHPSVLEIRAGERLIHTQPLPDDPSDARGIFSWHFQRSTIRLEDAGSYGYRVQCQIPPEIVAAALEEGVLRLRLSVPAAAAVDDAGGLALYGPRFGRYPFGPTLILHSRA
jgi:hypothetical protein